MSFSTLLHTLWKISKLTRLNDLNCFKAETAEASHEIVHLQAHLQGHLQKDINCI
jgi:hypothetical protein